MKILDSRHIPRRGTSDADVPAVLALDVGGTKVAGAVVDEGGRILAEAQVPTPAAEGGEKVLQAMLQLGQSLAAGHRVVAVGAGCAGQMSLEGVVLSATEALPGWAGMRVAEALRREFGLPAVAVNDAQAAAAGEQWLGAARGCRTALCLTVGTGIGGGLIVDGRLWRGSLGAAGEVGHLRVTMGGPRCGCGGYGCLEAYASGGGMQRRYEELAGERCLASEVLTRAERGDVSAKRVVEDARHALVTALTSLVNVLGLERVVVGGGMIRFLEGWLAHIEDGVRRAALPAGRAVTVRAAELGPKAGLLGAARLAWGQGRARRWGRCP